MNLPENSGGTMPISPHKFEFEGKEPVAFWIVISLLFANTILMLLLNFTGKPFLPQRGGSLV
jgi:hypothetical protein